MMAGKYKTSIGQYGCDQLIQNMKSSQTLGLRL
jgi:hypothetical protein